MKIFSTDRSAGMATISAREVYKLGVALLFVAPKLELQKFKNKKEVKL